MHDTTRSESNLNARHSEAAALREAARSLYRESLDARAPMTGGELGEQFGRSARWGNDRMSEVRNEGVDGAGGKGEVAQADTNGTSVAGDDHDLVDSATCLGPVSADLAESSPPDQPTPYPAVTPSMRRMRMMAVVVVALAAAVVSFDHQRELAEIAGEGWRAFLLPLSVDGLLLAASLTALERKRADESVGGMVWFALVLGVGASMAANVAAAEPTLEGRLVAAWPPVALKLSLAMLLARTKTVGAQRDLPVHGQRPARWRSAEVPGDGPLAT